MGHCEDERGKDVLSKQKTVCWVIFVSNLGNQSLNRTLGTETRAFLAHHSTTSVEPELESHPQPPPNTHTHTYTHTQVMKHVTNKK